MLELHATPLMGATLLLLFVICLWWFIVEWGFSKPQKKIRPAEAHTNDTRVAVNRLTSHSKQSLKSKRKEQNNHPPLTTRDRTKVSNPHQTAAESDDAALGKSYTDAKASTITKLDQNPNSVGSDKTKSANNKPGSISTEKKPAYETHQLLTADNANNKWADLLPKNLPEILPEALPEILPKYPPGTSLKNPPENRADPSHQKTTALTRYNAQEHQHSNQSAATSSAPNSTEVATAKTTDQTRNHTTDIRSDNDKNKASKPDTETNKSNKANRNPNTGKRNKKAAIQSNVTAAQNTQKTSSISDNSNADNPKTHILKADGRKTNEPKTESLGVKSSQANTVVSSSVITDSQEANNSKTGNSKPSIPTTSNSDTGNPEAVKAQTANQYTATEIKTTTAQTYTQKSNKQSLATPPKYQTAAKAKHPSSRSEASLLIPTPTISAASKTNAPPIESSKAGQKPNKTQLNTDGLTASDATSAKETLARDKPFNKSVQLPSAQNIQSIKPATDNTATSNTTNGKTTKLYNVANHVNSAPVPFNKHKNRNEDRKQSSIEIAVAQTSAKHPTEDSTKTNAKNSDLHNGQTNAAKTTPENLAKDTHGLNRNTSTISSQSGSQSTNHSDAAQEIDSDATLRAKLATSEKKIKTLQSTVNTLQDNLLSPLKPRSPQQHNRPTLLSKVRVLDQPKS